MLRRCAFVFVVLFFSSLPFSFAQNADEALNAYFVGPLPYQGPRIEVNVSARELRVYEDDLHGSKPVHVYPIAVGSTQHRTPIGERELQQIVWNPIWFPPKSEWAKTAKITPPGPRNPLGPVKMDLGGAILIHGTDKPQSIGQAASHGCMRMKSEDAIALATYLQQKTHPQTQDDEFAKYKKFNRRSFYVDLAQSIPVNIVYEIFEFKEGQLFVYKDVYNRYKTEDQFMQGLKDFFQTQGYELENYNLDVVKSARVKQKSQDLIFPITQLALENKTYEGVQAKNDISF